MNIDNIINKMKEINIQREELINELNNNNNSINYYYEKMGYNNLNMPKEKKNILKENLNDFENTFNNKLARSIILHKYIIENDKIGFLNKCTYEELLSLK